MKQIYIIILLLLCSSPCHTQDVKWELKWNLGSYFKGIDNYDSLNIMAIFNKNAALRRIIQSTDGGETWDYVYQDDDSQFIWPRGRDIAYPAKDFCIVSCDSSEFLKTTDGGQNWEIIKTEYGINDNDGFREIDMYDKNYGMMTTIFHMIVTSDGFKTWDTIPPTGTAGDYYIVRAEMLGPQTIAMINRDIVENNLHDWQFYRSEDAGKTWNEYPFPNLGTPSNLQFVDSLVGYNIGSVSTGIGDTKSDIVFKTTDGGQFWFNVMDTLIEGASNFGLNDFDFYDRDNGIVVGTYGKIYWTHDGGETWEYNKSEVINSENPTGMRVCMLSKYSAIIVTSNYVFKGQSGTSFVKTYDSQIQSVPAYPNPVSPALGAVTVQLPEGPVVSEAIIFDMSGRSAELKGWQMLGDGKILFALPKDISPGFYSIMITTQKKTFSVKLQVMGE